MSDAEKLHEIKLLLQSTLDDGDWYGAAGALAEEVLEIIDPDNSRLKPPPPPTPEELAESARRDREWRARMEAERRAASEAVVAGYLADCERLGLEPPKDLTGGPRFDGGSQIARLCPRIDTIYERPDGQVGTWPGIPAWEAFPSQAPPDTEAVAHVRVPANATSIVAQNIEVIAGP